MTTRKKDKSKADNSEIGTNKTETTDKEIKEKHEEILRYWTEERMQGAKPRSLNRDRKAPEKKPRKKERRSDE